MLSTWARSAAQYTREVLPVREELEPYDGTADGTVPGEA